MSSFIYKSSDNHPMKEIFEMYFLPLDFTVANYRIEVSTYNSQFFQDGVSLINTYGLVLNDFKEFANEKGEQIRFINFLRHSVENSHIHDYLTKIDFKIKNEHIYFERDGEKEDWINMGEFYMDNYQINSCGSYLFLTDILSNEQYMYYGD